LKFCQKWGEKSCKVLMGGDVESKRELNSCVY